MALFSHPHYPPSPPSLSARLSSSFHFLPLPPLPPLLLSVGVTAIQEVVSHHHPLLFSFPSFTYCPSLLPLNSSPEVVVAVQEVVFHHHPPLFLVSLLQPPCTHSSPSLPPLMFSSFPLSLFLRVVLAIPVSLFFLFFNFHPHISLSFFLYLNLPLLLSLSLYLSLSFFIRQLDWSRKW